MKIDLNRLNGVKRVIGREEKLSQPDEHIEEMVKNSITLGTIEPGAWIMSGFILSVVMQIVFVNRQQRPEEKLEGD
jgi:hypothetical protein